VRGPGQHTLKFFVYVVESPSAPDLYHGRSEGALVTRALELNSIPSVSRTAIDPEAFVAALKIGFPEVMKQFPGLVPILHLSAHGGTNGIRLSNGSDVGWEALQALIEPINRSLGNGLLLCMSACEGYHACQMAMRTDDESQPYWGMVGHYGKPTWSDTAVAYSAFYHLLSKGFVFEDAVDGMRAACGDDGWVFETAEHLKQAFLDFTKNDLEKAQQKLELVANAPDVTAEAKALESGTSG
jgi:hypothetical protein